MILRHKRRPFALFAWPSRMEKRIQKQSACRGTLRHKGLCAV